MIRRRNQVPAIIESELSAVEAACSPMERRFVYWLMNLPPKRGFKVEAAKLAGYNRNAEAVAYLRKLKALGVSREKLEQELGYSDLPRYERLLELEDAKNAAAPIDAEYTVIEDNANEP
jgi:hypothetical protein